MLWIIFTIWVVFIISCAIINNVTDNEIYGFLIILSIPVMFYIPFLIQCVFSGEETDELSVFSQNKFFVRITYEI